MQDGYQHGGNKKPMDKIEALDIVGKIRELLALGYRQTDIARRTGWSKQRVHYIAKGKRYNHNHVLTVHDLELVQTDKLCRKCGHPAIFLSLSCGSVCVKCAFTRLLQQKLIVVQKAEDS